MSDASLTLTYNGEIYNFREVRQSLRAKGRVCSSESDTEVLLKAFGEWGVDALPRLNGMFAFAVWNATERALYLVRDRLGVKPLYYHLSSTRLVFASEIKALFEFEGIPCRPDLDSLSELWALRYVVEPDTVFHGIQSLRPGHYLRITADSVKEVRWWSLPDVPVQDRPTLDPQRLGAVLSSAVELRKIADVPVGGFLSGGLDSSVIVSLMARTKPSPIAITAKFMNSAFDETKHATKIAERLGVPHRVIDVEASIENELSQVIWHLEQPIHDAAVIPTFVIARAASREVKVVLTGEGADEVCGGYQRYQRLARLATAARVWPRRIGPHHLPASFARGRRVAEAICAVAAGAVVPLPSHDGLSAGVRERIATKSGHISAANCDTEEALAALQRHDLQTWLVSDLLLKVDRMTMAHGLEARTPFLDYRVVELCTSTKMSSQVGLWETKRVLRKVARLHIGRRAARRRQHGFNVPPAGWSRWEPSLDGEGSELVSMFTARTERERFGRLLMKLWYRRFFQDRRRAA